MATDQYEDVGETMLPSAHCSKLVLARGDSHEHTHPMLAVDLSTSPKHPWRERSILQRMPGRLQEETLLRVHELGLTGRHPKEQWVELCNALQESAPFPVGSTGRCRTLGVPSFAVPPFLGNRCDQVFRGQQLLPQLIDITSPGEQPGHADNGNVLSGGGHNFLDRPRVVARQCLRRRDAKSLRMVSLELPRQLTDTPVLIELRDRLRAQARLHRHPQAADHQRVDPEDVEGSVGVHGALRETRGPLDQSRQPRDCVLLSTRSTRRFCSALRPTWKRGVPVLRGRRSLLAEVRTKETAETGQVPDQGTGLDAGR